MMIMPVLDINRAILSGVVSPVVFVADMRGVEASGVVAAVTGAQHAVDPVPRGIGRSDGTRNSRRYFCPPVPPRSAG